MTDVSDKIALTGRVSSWIEDSNKKLPVSCTVFSVEDSMEGESGIEDSWLYVSKALRNAAGVAVDLSKLRPQGTANEEGLVASGPCSFAQIYSKLNEILRRGGTFRNGAVTLYLDYNHPDAEAFISMSPAELPWAKRAIYVDENLLECSFLDKIIASVKNGTLWLAKKQWDLEGNRLYSNVCLEIAIPHRGTCLLSHVNLGACEIADIPLAFEEGMDFLCDLHGKTGVGEEGIYLPPTKDKQVGLGVIGLANLLAIEGISYKAFVEELERALELGTDLYFQQYKEDSIDNLPSLIDLVCNLIEGFNRASIVARNALMERAFTVAPTATCSYKYVDRVGYTTAPEISPPNCNPEEKTVIRESETFGNIMYEYHPGIEVACNADWDIQFRLFKAWQSLMDSTGLAHTMSFNIWDKCEVDRSFIEEWLNSSLKTTYYRLKVDQGALDKTEIISAEETETDPQACSIEAMKSGLECSACAE